MIRWRQLSTRKKKSTSDTEQKEFYTQPSLVAQKAKDLPAISEIQVQSLGGKDPPEKGMVTHSSIHAWKIPWTEEPGGPQPMGSQKSRTRLSN